MAAQRSKGPPPYARAELVQARALSHNVRHLRLRWLGEAHPFEAGQWVNIRCPQPDDAAPLVRAYSIASEPLADGFFELAVTLVPGGVGSGFLHRVKVGEEMEVQAPQGFFTLHEGFAEAPMLFVGTGTGITPLRSMLRHSLQGASTGAHWLLFGVRSQRDLLYLSEWQALAEEFPSFRFIPTLSRPDGDTWQGRTGYVQTHLAEIWPQMTALGEPHVYICGLSKMVKEVRRILRKELGATRQQVHSERFD